MGKDWNLGAPLAGPDLQDVPWADWRTLPSASAENDPQRVGGNANTPLPPPLSTSLNSALQQNHPFWPLEDFWEKTAWQCTPLTDEDTEVWRC